MVVVRVWLPSSPRQIYKNKKTMGQLKIHQRLTFLVSIHYAIHDCCCERGTVRNAVMCVMPWRVTYKKICIETVFYLSKCVVRLTIYVEPPLFTRAGRQSNFLLL